MSRIEFAHISFYSHLFFSDNYHPNMLPEIGSRKTQTAFTIYLIKNKICGAKDGEWSGIAELGVIWEKWLPNLPPRSRLFPKRHVNQSCRSRVWPHRPSWIFIQTKIEQQFQKENWDEFSKSLGVATLSGQEIWAVENRKTI